MELEGYFYSGQIRRFLIQFIRAVSGFQVEIGRDDLGNPFYQQVPVIYGDSSRQVAQLLINNSENTLPTTPCISVYISELKYDRERLINPTHVSKLHLHERSFDLETQEYSTTLGDSFTVERLVPVPYTLGIKMDIWTSSSSQKLQIVEQISTLFNPALEIQSTDNYVDWTSITAIFLEGTTWTSRSVPIGTNDPIDIYTYSFRLPIWLAPPAKVKKMNVIHKIIADVFDDSGNYNSDLVGESIIDASGTLITGNQLIRKVITPSNARLIYQGNTLQLLRDRDRLVNGKLHFEVGKTAPASWAALLEQYGKITPGYTQIRLMQEATGTEVIGTIALHPADDNLLLFTVFPDTIPSNTLDPVDGIIDPFKVKVDDFLDPEPGVRYIILDRIGDDSNAEAAIAWDGENGIPLVANPNDIIEYNGTNWFVAFSPGEGPQYVTNLRNSAQYRWDVNVGWVKSVEGFYNNGQWRIIL